MGAWRLLDQGQVRGGPARGRSRYPRPAVGAPSRRGSAIKPGSAGPRTPGGLLSARSPARRRRHSCAGCGCCRRSWSSPPPGPGPTQVNEGFGPGTPRWPFRGPSALGPRAPRRGCARGRWGGAGGGSGEARAAGRGGRGAAGAKRVRDCGVRGPRPSAGRRAGPGQGCVSEPPRRTLPFLTLSGVPPSVVGRCPSRGGSVLGGCPRPGARTTNWVRWGPLIPASHPGCLVPGRCQHPSPPELCREPGGGHPETRAKPVFPAGVIFV